MKKVKAFLLAGLTASMLVGCGAQKDESVVGISVE